MNKIKKVFRDDNERLTLKRRTAITYELGDVLWYVAEMCTALEMELNDIAFTNLCRLSARSVKDKIHGDGDNR